MSTKQRCTLPKSAFPLKFKVKSPSHALELAKGLILPFKHWIQNEFATDKNGDSVGPKAAAAEAFCALGALRRVNTKHARRAEKFLAKAAVLVENPMANEEVLRRAYSVDITGLNDNNFKYPKKQHKLVLKMFTKAISLARAWEAKAAGH